MPGARSGHELDPPPPAHSTAPARAPPGERSARRDHRERHHHPRARNQLRARDHSQLRDHHALRCRSAPRGHPERDQTPLQAHPRAGHHPPQCDCPTPSRADSARAGATPRPAGPTSRRRSVVSGAASSQLSPAGARSPPARASRHLRQREAHHATPPPDPARIGSHRRRNESQSATPGPPRQARASRRRRRNRPTPATPGPARPAQASRRRLRSWSSSASPRPQPRFPRPASAGLITTSLGRAVRPAARRSSGRSPGTATSFT